MIIMNNAEPTVGRKVTTDGFTETLREAAEQFNEAGINMIRSFDEIISEETTFSEYKNKLTESMTADEAEQFEQLMDNQRLGILKESSISGITPLAGLSMPTVRKMWVRTALKNALPTETAKMPTFAISYMAPYLRDADGTRHYLPDALRNFDNTLNEKTRLTQEFIKLEDHEGTIEDLNLITLTDPQANPLEAIDPIFYIEAVKITVDGQSKEVKVNHKADIRGQINAKVSTVNQDGDLVEEKLLGTIDYEKGLLTIVGLRGLLKEVKVKGWISSEHNTRTQSTGFEIKQKEVRIGTGAHLNSELPIEMIQDNLALYNIDATVECVDIMSKVVAHKLDQKIRQFLEQSFEASGAPFIGEFDVKPAAGFAGTPTQWKTEIRQVIDYWANKLKQTTCFSQGYFVVVGNRMDINLIPDINWEFRSINGEKAGVTVDYDLGAVTYNNAFRIVASDLFPQGEIAMLFIPADANHMTYKYYPYSFNIEKNYRSEQIQNVPNIMVTKRDTVEELIPAQARIKIYHNDGSLISSYAL